MVSVFSRPYKCIIQIEMYIRRPVFIAAGCLGRELGGNGNLVDFVVIGNDTRNLIFHIASGKPENIRLKMLLMCEITGVIDFADHRGGGGDPAGRVDLVGGVLSGAQIRLIFVIEIRTSEPSALKTSSSSERLLM